MTDLSELEALVGRMEAMADHLGKATDMIRFTSRSSREHAADIRVLLSTIRSQEAALVELRAERDNAVAITKRVQSAAKTIMIGESDELARLRAEKAGEWVATKTLDSEREANAILTDERDALRAALVEAREALEPFARVGELFDSGTAGFSDDDQVDLTIEDWQMNRITVGNLRRAACALSKLEGGE